MRLTPRLSQFSIDIHISRHQEDPGKSIPPRLGRGPIVDGVVLPPGTLTPKKCEVCCVFFLHCQNFRIICMNKLKDAISNWAPQARRPVGDCIFKFIHTYIFISDGATELCAIFSLLLKRGWLAEISS